MQIKRLIYEINPPCPKCPYKLRQIQTVVNPCPQCKLNGYQGYELFKKQLLGNQEVNENGFDELEKILYPDGIPVNIHGESIPLSKEEKEVQEEFDKYGITTLTPQEFLCSSDPWALLRTHGVPEKVRKKLLML